MHALFRLRIGMKTVQKLFCKASRSFVHCTGRRRSTVAHLVPHLEVIWRHKSPIFTCIDVHSCKQGLASTVAHHQHPQTVD